MSDYTVSKIFPFDKNTNMKIDALLSEEGIRRDANLDYTCAILDDKGRAIATGSTFGNTLRCLAVSSEHQGEGLLNSIVSHLIDFQYERGNFHLFLYTKTCTAKFFSDLGFHEIARIDGLISFMENKKTGFQDYLKNLERPQKILLKLQHSLSTPTLLHLVISTWLKKLVKKMICCIFFWLVRMQAWFLLLSERTW